MADNPAMPSEDEDFDAVHTGGPIISDFDDNQDDHPAAESKNVKVVSEDAEPGQAPEAEEQPEEQQPEPTEDTDAPEEPEAAEQVDNEEAEDAAAAEANEPAEGEEYSDQPESVQAAATPAPAVIAEPARPVKVKQQSKAGGGSSIGRTIFEVALIIALIAVGYYAMQLSSDKSDLKKQLTAANANPQTIIQKQTDDLIAKVGQLYNLPKNETPTVANVTDAAQAKKQSAFFTNAQNGDKVLMYVKAGEAILYRPSTDKIILVAPLTFTNNPSPTSTNPAGTTNSSTGN
ncbi:MAG TPA: hypothetical protein VG604_02160 [Candidatus Saccharimonadales bacterium]|nr:hypothetical protein [Candidatus Saccharimonadales bacterium]